ncbi:MAG TPA: chromate efflux transporter, partial [Gemmatimonadaceae bacterium]|nr:chromate efflux transporter [Gemmatimonadaceae bacterium]
DAPLAARAPVDTPAPPNETLAALFRRFFRFGLLAWGGPVAQIAMIREALVERERWISRERFNRVLAVYQALPGPEAHELCVYFGMLARGRVGAVLAGLGFMLPGLLLMLLLSWGYVRVGLTSPLALGAMAGCQGAVAALIARAVVRIGQHALTSRPLWLVALAVAASQLVGLNAIALLAVAGGVHALWLRAGDSRHAGSAHALLPAGALPSGLSPFMAASLVGVAAAPTLLSLFGTGLKGGLLTFGGAYTAIPFLRGDAVLAGGWMTDAQFLDGLALSAVLPAPFIIFSTFVGYLGGGLAGALAVTAGVFLPAFSFTLFGHEHLERMVENRRMHAFLDGVSAGVVGVIAVTAMAVARQTLVTPLPVATFAGALLILFRFRAPSTVAWVMAGAALVGGVFAGS